MNAVAAALRAARVAAIYLVHGTFLGPDALGVLTDLSRFAPGWADVLRRWNKQIVDALTGDIANFTRQYADTLQQALDPAGDDPIPVRLCHWSSENHHIGRADGAVRLIHDIADQRFPTGSRVLLCGHSHGGNVFALMTNLLGGELAAREEFFERARCYYRRPWRRSVDLPEWEFVRSLVCERERPFPDLSLDFVTLGTPIRYGWDSDGYAKLMHIVNHRPAAGLAEHQAPFPPASDDIMYAAHGDFIQQIGVAGTNFAPPLWAWRTWLADVRLGIMLQRDCRSAELYRRWQMGMRAHDEGENVFVDYGPSSAYVAKHVFGHAVYTRLEWQLFHAELIAQRFYGLVKADNPVACRTERRP